MANVNPLFLVVAAAGGLFLLTQSGKSKSSKKDKENGKDPFVKGKLDLGAIKPIEHDPEGPGGFSGGCGLGTFPSEGGQCLPLWNDYVDTLFVDFINAQLNQKDIPIGDICLSGDLQKELIFNALQEIYEQPIQQNSSNPNHKWLWDKATQRIWEMVGPAGCG